MKVCMGGRWPTNGPLEALLAGAEVPEVFGGTCRLIRLGQCDRHL